MGKDLLTKEFAEIDYQCRDGRTLTINTNMSPEQIQRIQSEFWASWAPQKRRNNHGNSHPYPGKVTSSKSE